MASEFKLHKVNVRSPYYINVENASDQTQDDIDPTPTEPLPETFSMECGDTVSIGTTVGKKIYEINVSGKQLGDYTINFSGLQKPIRYRLGPKGNLGSFQTSAGLNLYEPEWLAETGETVSLSNFVTNPNGVSDSVSYTYTQSDIDTYGNTLVLEIVHPLISTAYSFSSTCPAIVGQDDIDSSGIESFENGVIIVTKTVHSRGTGGSNPRFAGSQLGSQFVIGTERYIYSDASLNVSPTYPDSPLFKNTSLNQDAFNDVTNNYVGSDKIYTQLGADGKHEQILTFNVKDGGRTSNTTYTISRHPVYNDGQGNWKFKTWRDGEEKIQAVKININTEYNRCDRDATSQIRGAVRFKCSNTQPITSAIADYDLLCKLGLTVVDKTDVNSPYPIIQDA